MVVTALRRAEADVLQKYAALDAHNFVDREHQASATSTDMEHLVSARQALSEESGQMVSMALDHAQDQFLQHQCTFDGHSALHVIQPGIVGMLSRLHTQIDGMSGRGLV